MKFQQKCSESSIYSALSMSNEGLIPAARTELQKYLAPQYEISLQAIKNQFYCGNLRSNN